ncbi:MULTISPECIES: helix-turn-helix transcriptional regulator [unclassified Streptomyces]|uniref:helix-turn-helix domain-containing protein n=1 Tax=unclassified Streptomyces TaxID=2593676 RepID=UPI00081D5705|nr:MULTISPECIES: helix-turn-helix transcriptional regulator [unclassified Streptomyces]MYZ37516.1 helix-turn-helix domain-containing protein [Streptomyces sp. SID4917]SCF91906.1 Helix-turn-helix [Streptomyces sp. MnatMP-M17]
MTDSPTAARARKFAALVGSAAERAGYIGHGSQQRLADDTGMSTSSVSRMLKGKSIPEPKFFPAIAEKLDIPLRDLLVEMGIPAESLSALSETGRSQVGSRPITPSEAADQWGITDPIGREMLTATIERLKRLQGEDAAGSADETGGTAAQM